jgi:hypothetical protein
MEIILFSPLFFKLSAYIPTLILHFFCFVCVHVRRRGDGDGDGDGLGISLIISANAT